jgi:nucleotide-binding universal stress UspA family protein
VDGRPQHHSSDFSQEAQIMIRGGRVLVATDLTERSSEAIRQAHRWALAAEAELAVCVVVPNELHNNMLFPQQTQNEVLGVMEAEQSAADAVREQVQALTGRGVDNFRCVVETGSPHASIVEAAEELAAAVVVVGGGAQNEPDHRALGSVAARVVRYAHCPVLVARAGPASQRMLVATDFSKSAEPAVHLAAKLSVLLGLRISLFHCIDASPSPVVSLGIPFGASAAALPTELLEPMRSNVASMLKETLARHEIQGECVVVEGSAGAELVREALRSSVDLIVMGTSGRTGLARIALGNVAESVAAEAPCSVLVVRRGAETE